MKKFTIIMMTVCLCISTAIFAADGSWNLAAEGDWATAANWVGNNIADGAGYTAYFTNIANGTITADARTIGEIQSDAGDWWLNSGPITLDNSGSVPVINISGGGVALNCALAGTTGFNKTGAGWLMPFNTTISGDINVNGGVFMLMWADSIMNADVKVNNGASLYINPGVTANGKSVTVNSGGLLRPNGGTAGLNADLTLNYADTGNTFPIEAQANDVINLNSNITLAANTALAVSANGSTININAPISGAYGLRLLGRHDSSYIGIYNINAPCTYTGWTTLHSWGANPRYEIGVNQAFPRNIASTEFHLLVDNSSSDTSVTLDLNDNTQNVSRLVFNVSGAQSGHYAEITGNDAGLLIADNFIWSPSSANGSHVKLTGGKFVNNAASYNADMPLIITNATFIQNGSWQGGASAKFELQAGGKIGGVGFLSWNTGASTNLVIPANATISPGTSIGTLGCWNLEMQDGSRYDWEVGDTTADMVDVRGGLDISDGGITVNVIAAGSPDGREYTLFTTSDGITGSASDITLNYGSGVAGPVNPTISGNNIIAAIVPEPGIVGLLSLLGLALLRRK